MDASETVNLPAWQGQPGYFELWAVVIIDDETKAATWVRYATFAPADGSPAHATVWVADYVPGQPVFSARRQYGIDAYHAAPGRFQVTIETSEIAHGRCQGKFAAGEASVNGVASVAPEVAWSLEFPPPPVPVRRTPALLEQVRGATVLLHGAADVRATGYIEIAGQRRSYVHATATQLHVHGPRRLEEVVWLWAPRLPNAGMGPALLEVLSVQTHAEGALAALRTPRVTAMLYRHGDELEDLTQLPDALRPDVNFPGPGLVDISHTSTRRALRIRAWAQPRNFAAWCHHESKAHGRELAVANSSLASCVVEYFERKHPFAPWQLQARQRADSGVALELATLVPLEGVRYGTTPTAALPGQAPPSEVVGRAVVMRSGATGIETALLPPATWRAVGAGQTLTLEPAASTGVAPLLLVDALPAVYVVLDEPWPRSTDAVASLPRVRYGVAIDVWLRQPTQPAPQHVLVYTQDAALGAQPQQLVLAVNGRPHHAPSPQFDLAAVLAAGQAQLGGALCTGDVIVVAATIGEAPGASVLAGLRQRLWGDKDEAMVAEVKRYVDGDGYLRPGDVLTVANRDAKNDAHAAAVRLLW